MAGVNLDAKCGETLNISFACKDSYGSPSDLTGCTARMVMRSSVASDDVALDFDPAIPTPTDGVISSIVSASATSDITPGMYYWDCLLDMPEDQVLPLASGTIKFRQLVSRA